MQDLPGRWRKIKLKIVACFLKQKSDRQLTVFTVHFTAN
jgi:hypothetical protein